MTRTGLK